jgi:hypothetical protein
VLRTPVFELIQYLPQTEVVHEVPLLVVPPVLNRYYLADLAPGRSIVEHLVRGGVQVFALSWRNPPPVPDGAHRQWDLDTYGRAVLDGMDAAEHIARTERTSLMAFGAGATITAMLLAHLAATGAQHRVATVTLAATALDARSAPPDVAAARAAVAESERTGHLDGRLVLAELAWRAPDALLWPQAVHTYLCGAEPPATEVLFWLADTARAPAALHRDLVDVALRQPLSVPGAATLLGTPLDLAKVDRDCYLVAGAADPVTGWRDTFAAAGLFGGACRFVLATGGPNSPAGGWPGPRSSRAPGGRTTSPGSPPAADRCSTRHPGSAAAGCTRWPRRRAATCRSADPLRRLRHPGHRQPVGRAAGAVHGAELLELDARVGEGLPELVLVGDPPEVDRGDVLRERLRPLQQGRAAVVERLRAEQPPAGGEQRRDVCDRGGRVGQQHQAGAEVGGVVGAAAVVVDRVQHR